MPPTAAIPAERPTALRLFLIFSRIGLTSFGGGLSGWFLREFVQRRHWLSEEEFLNGLAIAQALPGVNVKNLAIWIGYHLAGRAGACAGFVGIILPPAVFIVLLGTLFSYLAGNPLSHVGLAGAAAAAIGLSLSMAITSVRRVRRRLLPWVFMVCVFVAVAVLRWPLLWVVLVLGGASVALEFLRLRGQPRAQGD